MSWGRGHGAWVEGRRRWAASRGGRRPWSRPVAAPEDTASSARGGSG